MIFQNEQHMIPTFFFLCHQCCLSSLNNWAVAIKLLGMQCLDNILTNGGVQI